MYDPRLAALRNEYETEGISLADLDPDPIAQFRVWMDVAIEVGIEQPNAMVLATADARGRPSARSMLLKGLDEIGFVFFTNYESRKAIELAEDPYAAIVIGWIPLHRQVRVEGQVRKTDVDVSDAYFAERPPGARIGAAASPQSRVIPSRRWLEEQANQVAAEHPDGAVPRPPQWGGYVLMPEVIELWQGRQDRLHDRIRYRREAGGWIRERLAP